MLKSKAITAFLLLALLTAVGNIFFIRQEINTERANLEAQAEEQRVLAGKLAAYVSLAAADSLFYAGDYTKARMAYGKLAAEGDSLLIRVANLSAREGLVGQLLRWQHELDTLRLRASRFTAVPTALPLPPPPPPQPSAVRPLAANPSAYDSLSLMLRQARRQILELRARVKETTGPNYLEFLSKEGNATYYVGEITDRKANGRGVALLSTGSRYEGEWQNNQKHGNGEFNWSDGARYVGAYANDERSGQGTYYFTDGSVYVGNWKNGLRDGKGVFTNAKGKVVARGIWREDELVEE